jgi:hypothetical protein
MLLEASRVRKPHSPSEVNHNASASKRFFVVHISFFNHLQYTAPALQLRGRDRRRITCMELLPCAFTRQRYVPHCTWLATDINAYTYRGVSILRDCRLMTTICLQR